jgi:AraC-like DNA-binding protein
VRPTGPIGAVIVHLKPEGAFRFTGGQMDAFTDANVGLSELFSPTEASLLEERLGEAAGAAQRAQYMQDFLVRCLRNYAHDAVVHQVIVELRRRPHVPVQQLASRFDISERQLSRRFHAMVGTSLKRFARVARLGKALAARRRGCGWAEIAQACGFCDQAHMIHDFQLMVGQPPEAILRTDVRHRDLNGTLATSGFSNTVVI